MLIRRGVLLLMTALIATCGGSNPSAFPDGQIYCSDDDQCPAGQACVGGLCEVVPDGGAEPDGPLPPPEIVVTPLNLDFGNPLLGVETTLTVEIANIGGRDLHVSSLNLVETDELAEYSTDGVVPFVIAAGASTTIDVTLLALDAEADLAELHIGSDDQDEPIVVVTLESELKGTPDLETNPTTVAYGTVSWGTINTEDVDVTNVGSGNIPLVVSAVSVTNDSGEGFLYTTELYTVVAGVETPATLPVHLSAGDATTPADLLRVRVIFEAATAASGPAPDEDLVIVTTDPDPAEAEAHLPISGEVVGCEVPTAEVCNGLDDDCDLTADEDDPGAGAACSSGLPGVCSPGVEHCVDGALDCIPDVMPGTQAETCDNVDEDCDSDVDDGLAQPCSSACGSGIEFCFAGSWVGCTAPSVPAESCNNVDDDCDGTIDDGDPGGGAACASMNPGVCGPGVQHCVAGVVQCVSTISPGTATETCNLLDDDCDGTADELDPGGGAACTSTNVGVCAPGTEHCVAGSVQCVSDVTPGAQPEVCNTLDDDCDGAGDEGDPGGGAACASTNVGVCAAGTEHCVAGSVECVSNVTPGAQAEVCNGLDDDCDGAGDEDDPGGGAACASTADGICQPGTQHCVSGAIACVPNVTPGSTAESCNGLDDDCDGPADEGDPGGGAACTSTANGVCQPGTQHCVSGAIACVPNVAPGTLSESCNGLDDDCDGPADEGDPEGGAACPSTNVGVCQPGTEHCVAGTIQCVSNVSPGVLVEVCNAADDDCDGSTDEGDPGGGASCSSANPGICTPGHQHCVSGSVQCVSDIAPGSTPEACNLVDDDCDAAVDDGDPGGGAACASTNEGICGPGTEHCVVGSIDCVSNVAPGTTPESCNGLDDNCDGTVDDGDPGGETSCSSGLPGICDPGVTHCLSGDVECVPNVVPGEVAETCNNVDDDCDGTIDDGNPGSGAACTSTATGVCQPGTIQCVSGSLQCVSNVTPGTQVETCDGLDNDCDGNTDESLSRACSTACGSGVEFCAAGAWVGCNAPPVNPETCDSIDNDCDGATDEGNPGGGGSCVSAASGICQPGTNYCTGGSIQCVSNVTPGSTAEACNSLDDDCDGPVDEGNPGGGGTCTTGQPGRCSPGHQNCISGSLSCTRDLDPISETCNMFDDDCNGVVDNGFNLSTDINNCGVCGNVCSVAHATETCSGGGCSIAACDSTWVNVDGTYSNGCECQDDSTETTTGSGDSCSSTIVLGSLNEGGSFTPSGKIATVGDEDWYQVTFNDNADAGSGACDPFRPNITFSANPGNAYRFQVYNTDCSTYSTCGGANLDDFKYYSGASTDHCCWAGSNPGPGRQSCTDQTRALRIRVIRTAGDASCGTYTLNIRNGP